MEKFEKGSEWRKWDLHIHTKDTNKNDKFKSSDFDSFCITFFKKGAIHKSRIIKFHANSHDQARILISKLSSFAAILP